MTETLRHLCLQKITSAITWELILVDNASTDNTAEFAENYWRQSGNIAPLKIIKEPTPGLSYARNTGIIHASYELLIFCDDDNWLNENYIQTVSELLNSDLSIGVVGGRNAAIAEHTLPFWFSDFQHYYAVGCQQLNSGEMVSRHFVFGAGMALRKSVYMNLLEAGFANVVTDRVGNSLVSGGDVEICYIHKIIGLKIWYAERLALEHFMPANRLTKSYLNRLQEGALISIRLLQVYDPYLAARHRNIVKKIFLFIYYIFLYLVAGIKKKDAAYFLTYIEANNILPFTFSRASARIRNITKRYVANS